MKKDNLASLKSVVDKLGIDKLVNVPSGLNSSKSKGNGSDVHKLKPGSIDLKN